MNTSCHRLLIAVALASGLLIAGCAVSSVPVESSSPAPPSNSAGSADLVPGKAITAANANAPIIHLHRDEEYFPASIDWFLKFSTLTGKSAAPTSRADIAGAGSSAKLTPDPGNWFKNGQKAEAEKGKWPAYIAMAHVKVRNTRRNEYLIVQYNTFYPFNSFSRDMPGRGYAGKHYGDWERVSIFLYRPNGSSNDWSFLAAMTKAHDLPLYTTTGPEEEGGRTKAYASLRSHGTWSNADDSPTNVTDVRSDWGGVAWDLARTPNEVVKYKEYVFEEIGDFATRDAVRAALSAGRASETIVFSEPWADYGGRWGNSTRSEPFDYWGNEFRMWENSPGTNIGVGHTGTKGEIYELSAMLSAGFDGDRQGL